MKFSQINNHYYSFKGLVQIIDWDREPFAKELTFFLSTQFFMSSVPNKIFTVKVSFRNCEIGEYFDISQQQCLVCPKFFYSFEKNFSTYSSCHRCLATHPFFCYGGNNISTKPGFWRVSEISGDFMSCPNRGACVGDSKGPEEAFNLRQGVSDLLDFPP